VHSLKSLPPWCCSRPHVAPALMWSSNNGRFEGIRVKPIVSTAGGAKALLPVPPLREAADFKTVAERTDLTFRPMPPVWRTTSSGVSTCAWNTRLAHTALIRTTCRSLSSGNLAARTWRNRVAMAPGSIRWQGERRSKRMPRSSDRSVPGQTVAAPSAVPGRRQQPAHSAQDRDR